MSQILFRNFSLLDPRWVEARGGYEVLVEGGTIKEVSNKPIKTHEARVIDRVMPCDREEPGRERGGLGERRQPLQRDREHVLHEIRGLDQHHAREHHAVDRAMEPAIERRERVSIAGARGRDEGDQVVFGNGVRDTHLLRDDHALQVLAGNRLAPSPDRFLTT